MKSVLHVINGELYSGAERVQDLLALNLIDLNYSVSFACIKPGLFSKHRQARDAVIYNIHMRSKFDVLCAFKLAKIIKRDKFDLIHTHTPRSAMVGRIASIITGIPMVHHIHSPTTRDTENVFRNKINSIIENISLFGVKQLIPVSQSLKQYLLDLGYPDTLISVVPNGVPALDALSNKAAPDKQWILGSVALFRPRKGLEVLLQALADVKSKGFDVRLRAVGGFEVADFENEIKTLSQDLNIENDIDWTGFTNNVNKEFSQIDIFVLPSLYGEGMPMVILESMTMGVPVVASDVEGIPEVLTHGVTGIIVKAGDVSELSGEIIKFIQGENDWAGIRENAYQKHLDAFSDKRMAERIADVYTEVLADE